MGKHHNLPLSQSQTMYTHPLELVQTDVWGPSPMLSFNGYKYYVSFVDMYSGYTWLYLLKTKSEVAQVFKVFKSTAELQLGSKLKTLQTDYGKEFLTLTSFLESFGIKI